MTPTRIRRARATAWIDASCSSHSICTQQWRAMRSGSAVTAAATAGDSGSCRTGGQRCHGNPWISASMHHVANRSIGGAPGGC